MGVIINLTDFKSNYSIATDVYTSAELQEFIAEREEPIMISLLGKELYDLFKADLIGGVPQTAKYIKIFNPFFELINSEEVNSQGMVVMVAKFLYASFAAEQSQNNSIGGNVQSKGTINTPSQINFNTILFRFNEAQSSYSSIQYYIEQNEADYLGYNGVLKPLMSWV